MDTYRVKFKCTNCSYIFTKELEMGVAALGRAGACTNCGCSQDTTGPNGQKIGVFPIVSKSEPKSSLELLLEELASKNPFFHRQTERSGK
jgi:hypothetical protein